MSSNSGHHVASRQKPDLPANHNTVGGRLRCAEKASKEEGKLRRDREAQKTREWVAREEMTEADEVNDGFEVVDDTSSSTVTIIYYRAWTFESGKNHAKLFYSST